MSKLIQVIGFLGGTFFSLASQAAVIHCASEGFRYKICPVNEYVNSVEMIRQTSRGRCVQGVDWGYTRNSIWVDNGCSADFAVNAYDPGDRRENPRDPRFPPGAPGHYRDRVEQIRCSARGFRIKVCVPETAGRIVALQLIEQRSLIRCVFGRNYGATYNYIWVTRGCRGDFLVTIRRPRF